MDGKIEVGSTAMIAGELYRKDPSTSNCEGCAFSKLGSLCPCGVDGGSDELCSARLDHGGNDCHEAIWTHIPTVPKDPKDPKDPKTKYHRPMYPAWNDTEVHTDANGHQYLDVDVYSVLTAFDPGHEAAHAVKKLLAAGTRDKGSKIQDYREAIISIEAAIYRAEIEGGAG